MKEKIKYRNVLEAPRHSVKRKTTLNKFFYDFLFNKYPALKYKYSTKEISNIVRKFNDMLVDEVITNRDGAEIPIFAKFLYLSSYKPIVNRYVMDYGHYNKTKGDKTKALNNMHSNGLVLKIVYKQLFKKGRRALLNFYAFTPARDMSRKCSKAFRENHTLYKIMSFKDVREDDNNACRDEIDIDLYNEFDL